MSILASNNTSKREQITENLIKEASEEPDLTKVYELSLHNRKLDAIGPTLLKCVKLRSLDLSFNHIQRIENLHALGDLRELKVYHNEISSLEGLQKNVQLQALVAHENSIERIGGSLMTLRSLKTLSLSANQLKKVEGLEKNAQLTSLDLAYNQITKIEGINHLAQLEDLFFEGNKIRVIGGLAQCVRLKELHLSKNEIEKVAGLETLTALESLWLDSNQLTSIELTSPLTRVCELFISNNRLDNAALAKLPSLFPSLDALDFGSNAVDDFAAVEGLKTLTGLMNLRLQGNPVASAEGYKKKTISIFGSSLQILDHVRLPAAAQIMTINQGEGESEDSEGESEAEMGGAAPKPKMVSSGSGSGEQSSAFLTQGGSSGFESVSEVPAVPRLDFSGDSSSGGGGGSKKLLLSESELGGTPMRPKTPRTPGVPGSATPRTPVLSFSARPVGMRPSSAIGRPATASMATPRPGTSSGRPGTAGAGVPMRPMTARSGGFNRLMDDDEAQKQFSEFLEDLHSYRDRMDRCMSRMKDIVHEIAGSTGDDARPSTARSHASRATDECTNFKQLQKKTEDILNHMDRLVLPGAQEPEAPAQQPTEPAEQVPPSSRQRAPSSSRSSSSARKNSTTATATATATGDQQQPASSGATTGSKRSSSSTPSSQKRSPSQTVASVAAAPTPTSRSGSTKTQLAPKPRPVPTKPTDDRPESGSKRPSLIGRGPTKVAVPAELEEDFDSEVSGIDPELLRPSSKSEPTRPPSVPSPTSALSRTMGQLKSAQPSGDLRKVRTPAKPGASSTLPAVAPPPPLIRPGSASSNGPSPRPLSSTLGGTKKLGSSLAKR